MFFMNFDECVFLLHNNHFEEYMENFCSIRSFSFTLISGLQSILDNIFCEACSSSQQLKQLTAKQAATKQILHEHAN